MLLGLAALANHERDLVRYQFAERTISGTIVEQLLANVGRLVDRTRAEGRTGYLRASQRMVQFFATIPHRALYPSPPSGIDAPHWSIRSRIVSNYCW